ncbi:MAG: molybdenum cofactor guanylyltransferase [Bacillaceae bacterium]|nr:molybdenum cofactor guanylyltransferase [Bacillaceae bacterium]
MKTHHILGVLLAGGASRRFGEPKALYELDGKPFIQYSLDALHENTEDIVIVSQPDLIHQIQQQSTYDVILDEEQFRGDGPLAGIYSAMKHVHSEWYMVLPCDTPYIHSEVLYQLRSYTERYSNIDAIVPKVAGRKQPLIAMYNRRCLPIIEKNLKENCLKIGMLFQAVETMFIEEHEWNHPEAFRNINEKDDLSFS